MGEGYRPSRLASRPHSAAGCETYKLASNGYTRSEGRYENEGPHREEAPQGPPHDNDQHPPSGGRDRRPEAPRARARLLWISAPDSGLHRAGAKKRSVESRNGQDGGGG